MVMLITTEAFVLKSRKYNEADSLMVLFSRKLGKISAVAKGSRRAKSQMLAGIQPFCHSSFVLYQGRSLYTVNQVEARRIFYPLREDLQETDICLLSGGTGRVGNYGRTVSPASLYSFWKGVDLAESGED
jgi:DNA repair protein RecO